MQTILLVEDDKILSNKIKKTLEIELDDTATIFTAYSVQEALDISEMTNIDLFILDIKLPDGDGVELGKELRKTHEFNPIMIASSVSDPITKAEINNDLDIFLYLTKPYNPSEMLPKIKGNLKRLKSPNNNIIMLKKGVQQFKVDINEVVLVNKIKSLKKIEVISLNQETSEVSSREFTMQSLDMLPDFLNDPKDLIRVNQSQMINPRFVDYYDGIKGEIHLKGIDELPTIGKLFKDKIHLLFR